MGTGSLLTISLADRLDIKLGFKPLARDAEREVLAPADVTRASGADPALPEALRWRSALVIERANAPWRAIYTREGQPVAIERPYGGGTLVVLTDSFYLGNEALRDDRQPALLAWLVGSTRRVIFDETHLGIREDPGVMTLARRYRLHGVLAVLALLGALFVWKSVCPLVPPADESEAEDAGGDGRDAWAGLVDLLRRNIPESRILRVSLEEWSRGRPDTPRQREIERAMRDLVEEQEALPAHRRRTLAAWRAMASLASRRIGAAGPARPAEPRDDHPTRWRRDEPQPNATPRRADEAEIEHANERSEPIPTSER